MDQTVVKEGHLQFYCLQRKKWLKYWVQLAESIMGGSLEVFPNQEDATDPQSRILFISFLSASSINMQVIGNFKSQPNCFQIKAEGITYTFSTQSGPGVHEWISIIHNYIQPQISYSHTLYSTINEVKINPDVREETIAISKEVTPPDSSTKNTKTRRSSTTEKFKSMFRGTKRNKSGKQNKAERASSDTELPLNPSPPNLEELYSKVTKKTKQKEKDLVLMEHESPLSLGIVPLPKGDSHMRGKEYYSDPSNIINSIEIGAEPRTKTKRLRTRSERSSGRRSQPEDSFSSSGDECQSVSSHKKMSKNSKSSFTDVTEGRVSPTLLFPPPPSRPPSNSSGIKTQNTHEREISSPRPVKKSSKRKSKQSPVVRDAHFDFQPIINGNSVLLPERQNNILRLKAKSSSEYTEEDPASPPTKENATHSHPKKRLSVGSPPVSAKDIDSSFPFPEQDISTHSLPITSTNIHPVQPANTKQTTLKVVTKAVSEVGTSMQPYVNVPQLVKTEGIEGPLNAVSEFLDINSPESKRRILQDRSSQTDSPTSMLTDLSINRESYLPPRPKKPPSLTQPDYPFKKTKLKSSLKRKNDNSSISSTSSSIALGDFDRNIPERPNLKVNFGGTTEIPITPNSSVIKNTGNNFYKNPKVVYKEGLHGYLDFTIPYGNDPQHDHFYSDPHIVQRMPPQAVYYPSSLHVPSMVPAPYENQPGESYLDEAFEYNNSYYREPLAIQYDYNSGIPYHPGPPPFMSYSTDPNIQEQRSRAYSAHSMQNSQQSPLTSVSCRPTRPAPAPPRNPPNSRYFRESKQAPYVNNNNNIKIGTNQETTV